MDSPVKSSKKKVNFNASAVTQLYAAETDEESAGACIYFTLLLQKFTSKVKLGHRTSNLSCYVLQSIRRELNFQMNYQIETESLSKKHRWPKMDGEAEVVTQNRIPCSSPYGCCPVILFW